MPKIVDHDARRNEIAHAACRAIAKKGLDSVTLTDIAREARCTTGMLAHYFNKKWDLILAALRLMHDRLERKLSARLLAGASGLADLLVDALPIDAEHRSETAAWLTFWGVALGRPKLLKWSTRIYMDWRALVRRCVLETNTAAGHWPKPLLEDVVSSIILFMDGLYVKAMTRPVMYPAKTQIRLLRAHVKALLAWAEQEAVESGRHRRPKSK